MTERELVALMAAAIYPSIDGDGGTISEGQSAVRRAFYLLGEVDKELEARWKFRPTESENAP